MFFLLTFSICLVEGCTQIGIQPSIFTIIDYDRADIAQYTTSSRYGNLFPLKENNSIVILGQARICLIDNLTGKIIKNFDESALKLRVEESIQQFYNGSYVIPIDEEDYRDLPYCAKFPFYYDRIFKVGDNLFACYIMNSVVSIDLPRISTIIYGIGFFDNELNLISYYTVEQNPKQANIYIAGFVNENIFWARYANPTHKNMSDFVLYENKSRNRFEFKGEIANILPTEKLIYYPGRFFSITPEKKGYLINTGTKLLWNDDFSKLCKVIPLPMEDNEAIAIIEKVTNHHFVVLKIKIDSEGVAWSGRLFGTDSGFKQEILLKEYDFVKVTVNSIKALYDKLYIFYFDKEKDKYMLEVIDLAVNRRHLKKRK
ncbi:MAG: hypothetical protein QXP66_04445 [Candidatus Aenigmatarchaeota archaeon]